MTGDGLGWAMEAAAAGRCEFCSSRAVTEVSGRELCGWHRDMRSAVAGEECGECGSSEWVVYDREELQAVCVGCEWTWYEGEDEFPVEVADAGLAAV